MADERISYEMLQDMLRSERRSNKLTPVHARFWHDVRAFLDAVMENFREEQQKDPFSRRVMMVTDEVKNARQAAESIWALRERKMSLFALSQTLKVKPERPDGLTGDEEKVYDHILASLQAGRRAIMEGAPVPKPGDSVMPKTAAPAAPAPAPAAPAAPQRAHAPAAPAPGAAAAPPAASGPAPTPAPAASAPAPSAAPDAPRPAASGAPTAKTEPVPPDVHAPVEEDEPDRPEPDEESVTAEAPAAPSLAEAPVPPTIPADTPDVEMLTIRALSDIPAFVGPDMQTYLLREGDVATVPKAIGTLLERRKKAAVVNL